MSFTGRTAVVTGGSRGIGRAICLELARRGANVVFSYAGNTAAAEATRKELEALGVQTRAVQGSVADPAAVKTLIDTAVKELGSLDILVNNAGITRDNLAMMLKEEDFDAVIETNLKGAFLTMKAAARPMMKARYGRIVNLSSVGGVFPNSGFAYAAAKSAVIGMTRNMAMQFAAEGIRVNAVCPGGTKTPMIEAMNDPDQMLPCDKEFARITGRHFNTKLPMCTAEEQANAILFLASDEASGITGQYLVVDHGGWI